MKYWIQFLQESSGYVEGSIPPKFEESAKRLIDACGTDGVFTLDGRNSQYAMLQDAYKQAQRLQHWKKYKGFVLCKGSRLFDESQRSKVYSLSYPITV